MTTPQGSKERGDRGEQAVARALEAESFSIVATNFRCPQGEIDIIAYREVDGRPYYAFVEVKTRTGRGHGSAAEAVSLAKRRRIIAAAQAFLARVGAGGHEPGCRFDIAEVYLSAAGAPRIVMRRGAFDAG